VSAYLPNVLVGSPRPITGTPSPPTAFNAVVGLASRRRLTATRHVVELSQQPLPQWHVAAPDLLPRGEGRSEPLRPAQEHRPPGGPAPTRGGTGPPVVVWARGDRPRAPCPCEYVEAQEHGVRSGDRDPSCQVQTVRPGTQRLRARLRVTLHLSSWTH
jgi:hypothetical protein